MNGLKGKLVNRAQLDWTTYRQAAEPAPLHRGCGLESAARLLKGQFVVPIPAVKALPGGHSSGRGGTDLGEIESIATREDAGRANGISPEVPGDDAGGGSAQPAGQFPEGGKQVGLWWKSSPLKDGVGHAGELDHGNLLAQEGMLLQGKWKGKLCCGLAREGVGVDGQRRLLPWHLQGKLFLPPNAPAHSKGHGGLH